MSKVAKAVGFFMVSVLAVGTSSGQQANCFSTAIQTCPGQNRTTCNPCSLPDGCGYELRVAEGPVCIATLEVGKKDCINIISTCTILRQCFSSDVPCLRGQRGSYVCIPD